MGGRKKNTSCSQELSRTWDTNTHTLHDTYARTHARTHAHPQAEANTSMQSRRTRQAAGTNASKPAGTQARAGAQARIHAGEQARAGRLPRRHAEDQDGLDQQACRRTQARTHPPTQARARAHHVHARGREDGRRGGVHTELSSKSSRTKFTPISSFKRVSRL